MTDRVETWIESIVVDCRDLPRMMAFWQEALHYIPRDPPEPDGVVLKDPEGRGPNLSLNLTTEGPLEDYRIHLDSLLVHAGKRSGAAPPTWSIAPAASGSRTRLCDASRPGWEPLRCDRQERVVVRPARRRAWNIATGWSSGGPAPTEMSSGRAGTTRETAIVGLMRCRGNGHYKPGPNGRGQIRTGDLHRVRVTS